MSSEPNEVLKRVTNEDEKKVEKDRKRKSTEMEKANRGKRKYATTNDNSVFGGHTLVTMMENYHMMFMMMFPLNTLRK